MSENSPLLWSSCCSANVRNVGNLVNQPIYVCCYCGKACYALTANEWWEARLEEYADHSDMPLMDAVLCYIERPWAYFTTQKLNDQWGDNWDDVPYEYNAGLPYEGKSWKIYKVAWDGNFETPCDQHPNSHWSVIQINAGAIAWLRSTIKPSPITIQAGTTFRNFCQLMQEGGGTVYLPQGKYNSNETNQNKKRK